MNAPRRPPLRRLVQRLGVGLGSTVALVSASTIVFARYHALQRDNEFERIRSAGEPVFAAELPSPSASSPATLAWMRAFVGLPELRVDELLRGADPDSYRAKLAVLLRSDAPRAVIEAARAFDRALSARVELSGRGDEAVREELELLFAGRELDSVSAASPVRLAWLELVVAEAAPHCALGTSCRGLAPLSLNDRRELEAEPRHRANGWPPSRLAGFDFYAVASSLQQRAIVRALRGDSLGSARDAHAILDLAALASIPTDEPQFRAYLGLHFIYLRTVEQVLCVAPPTMDCGALDLAVSPSSFSATLRRALHAARATWNDHCAALAENGLVLPKREPGMSRDTRWDRRWFGWIFRARNQRFTLDQYARWLKVIDQPRAERTKLLRYAERPFLARLAE